VKWAKAIIHKCSIGDKLEAFEERGEFGNGRTTEGDRETGQSGGFCFTRRRWGNASPFPQGERTTKDRPSKTLGKV